jgi:uncharacterized protein YeaO (DUF488 family)
MSIKIKRAYEKPERNDGRRILVDRLWPRGLTKERAKIDLWLKELAPSTELRKWFGHDPAKWSRFRDRYKTEIRRNDDKLKKLVDEAGRGDITLIYAARDVRRNEAVVLQKYLEKMHR